VSLLFGTFRTWRDVRLESFVGGKADLQSSARDPEMTDSVEKVARDYRRIMILFR